MGALRPFKVTRPSRRRWTLSAEEPRAGRSLEARRGVGLNSRRVLARSVGASTPTTVIAPPPCQRLEAFKLKALVGMATGGHGDKWAWRLVGMATSGHGDWWRATPPAEIWRGGGHGRSARRNEDSMGGATACEPVRLEITGRGGGLEQLAESAKRRTGQ
jgi:hypothetical protein